MSITFPDKDLYYGADVAHWQRFLKSRGLYLGDINGTFDSPTKGVSIEFQRQQHLHEREPVDDVVLEVARSLGYEIPQQNPPGEYFHRDGRIELSLSDRGPLNRLAYLYYLWTGKRITVTSGTRTPRAQAEAMYENWHYHRNAETHYKNREAAREIHQAYDAPAGRGTGATIDAMTAIIEIKCGIRDLSRCILPEGRLT